jgi:hypothetical protein
MILGAAVLGVNGGEIMREAVFAHPTLAESLNNLFAHFDG